MPSSTPPRRAYSARRRAISRRDVLTASIAGTLTMAASSRGAQPAAAGKRPNIVFLLADDLGYADLSCYGRHISTPRIDSLARDGVMLTQAYSSSCVCSPTRVALMTGRYPGRIRTGLDEPLSRTSQEDHGLSPDLPTLPAQLREAGYRTALIGKWHLGKPPKFGPLKSGYDRFFGVYDGYSFYFGHGKDDPSPIIDGERVLTDHGYLTELLADKAIDELRLRASSKQPLFLSLHFNAPHWPWEGPGDAAKSPAIKDPWHKDGGSLETYRAMVQSLDLNVGRVLDAIAELNLSKDTLVVFTSDNGGERFSDMWPLSGMKGELLEGGIRVPLLARWTGRNPAGSRSFQTAQTIDWLPTLLAAAGASPSAKLPADGDNILPVLLGEREPYARTLFWRHKGNEQAAVRDGDLKYLKLNGYEYLFNVAADPRERSNLASAQPETFVRLKQLHERWSDSLLPYPVDASSYDVHGGTADRY